MAEYKVTHVSYSSVYPDPRRISKIGGIGSVTTLLSGASAGWFLTREEAHYAITGRVARFYTTKADGTSKVYLEAKVEGDTKYVETAPDATTENNLYSLTNPVPESFTHLSLMTT